MSELLYKILVIFVIALMIFVTTFTLHNIWENNRLYQECLNKNVDIAKIYKDKEVACPRTIDCTRR